MSERFEKIRIVDSNQIDEVRWDKLNESLEYPYFTSRFYLDSAWKDWSAVVVGNYEACFPIKIKKIGFWRSCIHPLFIRTLDCLGNQGQFKLIVEFLKKEFSIVHIYVPIHLRMDQYSSTIRFYQKLCLKLDYDQICSNYSQNTKRQISKFSKSNCTILNHNSITELNHYFNFFQEEKKGLYKEMNSTNINVLKSIVSQAKACCEIVIKEIRIEDRLIAFGIFILQDKKALYLKGVVNDEGKKIGAMYALFNDFIKSYSNKIEFLDFGGSNDKGLADFNLKFGAKNNKYINLTFNKLPYPINKWMAKRYNINENSN